MTKLLEIAQKWWFWFALVFVLYANTLNHEYVVDDQIVITNNKLTKQGVSAIPEIFKHSYLYAYNGREDESYRPLTLSTFALERSLFDANPAVSHFIQIVLYGLTIFVLFKLLSLLFPSDSDRKWMFLITLLFAVHPIHTEVVANVKSRDELLCALFLFASLFYFVKFLKEKKRVLTISISLVLYFVASLSKETAIPAIVLFPVLGWYLGGRRELFISVSLLVPVGIYFLLRSAALSNLLFEEAIDPVANSLAWAHSGKELYGSNFAIFAKYLQLLVFPWKLSWDYSIAQLPIVGFGSTASIIGLLSSIVLVLLSLWGLIKRNWAGLGGVIFISTFIITSNFFFLINCPLGERFMFIPVLGLLFIVVHWLKFLVEKISGLRNAATYFGIAVVALFALRSIVRNMDWKNNLAIYKAGVDVCPNSVKTHFNLGTEYITQANKSADAVIKKAHLDSALISLEKAAEIYPWYVNIYENRSFALTELSKLQGANRAEQVNLLLAAKKTIDLALDTFHLYKENLLQNQYYNLNELIKLESDSVKRSTYFYELFKVTEKSLDYNQTDYHNAFYALSSLGKKELLIALVEKYAANFPEIISLTSDEALKYFNAKDYESAIRLLTVYLNVVPKDFGMKTNVGMMYELKGDKEKARTIYQEVLKDDPTNGKAQTLLGNLR